MMEVEFAYQCVENHAEWNFKVPKVHLVEDQDFCPSAIVQLVDFV